MTLRAIRRLATVLRDNATRGLVGIEGAPFVGKSSFAARIAAEHNAWVIPEHTEFDDRARSLCSEKWPVDLTEALSRQQFMLSLDNERSRIVERGLSEARLVVLDRTFLSPIAYAVARAHVDPDCWSIADQLIDEATSSVLRRRLLVPHTFHLLSCDTAELGERLQHPEALWRCTDPLLLDAQARHTIQQFYEDALALLPAERCIRSGAL
jgi:thymidylate kinase